MNKKIKKSLLVAGGLMMCAGTFSAHEAEAAIYSSTDTPMPIANAVVTYATPGITSSMISISDDFIIGAMTVTLDISHDWVGELEIALRRDDGDAATTDPFIFLVQNDGNANTNLNVFGAGEGYTFSDTAISYLQRSQIPFPYIIPGNLTSGGTSYIPDDSRMLYSTPNGDFNSLFGGLSSQADWVLEIYDIVAEDYDPTIPEALFSWQMDLQESTAVPIPGAAWLLASGLVGLVAWKKRSL